MKDEQIRKMNKNCKKSGPLRVRLSTEKKKLLTVRVGLFSLREKAPTKNIIEYGCAAHQLNLVAKNLVPSAIVNKVIDVAKLFRNSHLHKSGLENESCQKPPMPSAVRWNSVADLLDLYVSNWQKLKKITDDHVMYFNKNPAKSVMTTLKSMSVFKNVEDALKCIKPISIAFDRV